MTVADYYNWFNLNHYLLHLLSVCDLKSSYIQFLNNNIVRYFKMILQNLIAIKDNLGMQDFCQSIATDHNIGMSRTCKEKVM